MPERNIEFPFAGRVDSAAHHDQPALTTRQALNMRARRRDGRLTGATRSGLVKWNETALGSTRVRALASVALDDRKITYAGAAGSEEEVWAKTTPSRTGCLGGRTDRQGNVYALDGNAGIVKFNSAGKQVLKIALPVEDSGHVVRALWVDDADRIFAGVSEGGDVETARVWCVLQLEDDEYFVLWTLTPGAYTEELRVYRGSQLYAAHNYPQENRSRVLVYGNIGLDPIEETRIETVAYPITAMDLGEDGELYTAAANQTSIASVADIRSGSPSAREFHAPIEGWTLADFPFPRQVWSHFDAAAIDEADVEQTRDETELTDGQQVLRWPDLSGNGRHWYAGDAFGDPFGSTGESGPTYLRRGIGGLPSVRFFNQGTTKQSMVSLGNTSRDKTLADQQRTPVPAYDGAMWAMFILYRPDQDAPGASPRLVWFADNEAGGGSSDHSLWHNRACGATVPGTYDQGVVSYFATTDGADPGACGGADQAADFDAAALDRDTGCVLVTVLWDGGVDPNDTGKTRCQIRVNGRPVDRFEGLAFASLQPQALGIGNAITAVANRLNGEIAKMLVIDRRDRFDDSTEPKILTHDFLEDGDGAQAQSDDEVSRIEAWIMYGRGLGHLLPQETDSATIPTDNFWHFYALADNGFSVFVGGPPAPGAGGLSEAHAQLLQVAPHVAKHDAQGALKWVCNVWTHPDTGVPPSPIGTEAGGIGYGVVSRKLEDGTKCVFTAGTSAYVFTGQVAVRKVIDLGESFSGLAADGAWRHKNISNRHLDYENPRLAADKFGNLFLPYFETDAAAEWSLLVFKPEPDGSGNAQVLVDLLLSGDQQAHGVALPPDAKTPDYRGDLADEVAEFCYLFTRNEDDADVPTVTKVRLVTSSANATGSPRQVVTLAVGDNDLKRVTETTQTVVSGGSGVVDAGAQYVQLLHADTDVVLLDGVSVRAYKLRDAVLEELVSTTAGELPPRPKLGMFWRHRLVLGNFADNPGGYAASALGDIRDWDLRIVNPTATQAFAGDLTRAGEAEDAIVAMIPVWDDLAFLVGESRILRLTGDPQDGGNIHKVTDSLGGVFGDSWCVDAQGRVFMFGNRPPGLYRLQPEGDPIPLSRHSLEETEFEAIDFSTHRISLAWNPIDKGVHVWQVAWSTSTVVDHWFWEERTHRLVRQPPLWTDRFATTGLQPTCYTYLGEDDTRCLLVGCADGYVRKWSPSAAGDDGNDIDSYVMFQLTPRGGTSLLHKLRQIQVTLSDDYLGARLELFSSEVADHPGPVQKAFELKPGLNPRLHARLRGSHLYARIRGVAAGGWAFEGMVADVEPVSRAKARRG